MHLERQKHSDTTTADGGHSKTRNVGRVVGVEGWVLRVGEYRKLENGMGRLPVHC